jgi:hypothetical protein
MVGSPRVAPANLDDFGVAFGFQKPVEDGFYLGHAQVVACTEPFLRQDKLRQSAGAGIGEAGWAT